MVARIGGLTQREQQIAGLVADGLTNQEIGDELGVSASTVKNHLTAIMRVLRMTNRAQLAVWWVTRQRRKVIRA